MKKLVDLVDDGNILIPKVFSTFDINNILINNSISEWTSKEFTINENGYLYANSLGGGQRQGGKIVIDGVDYSLQAGTTTFIPLKKGTYIIYAFGGYAQIDYKVFGIKYN